jgi:ADP-ribose pyrophosphatase
LVGDGNKQESLEIAAIRELEEETGWQAESMKKLIWGPGSSGSSNTLMTFFEAQGLKKIGTGGGAEGEVIIVHEIEIETVEDWLLYQHACGKAIDPKIFTGLYFWLKKQGKQK